MPPQEVVEAAEAEEVLRTVAVAAIIAAPFRAGYRAEKLGLLEPAMHQRGASRNMS